MLEKKRKFNKRVIVMVSVMLLILGSMTTVFAVTNSGTGVGGWSYKFTGTCTYNQYGYGTLGYKYLAYGYTYGNIDTSVSTNYTRVRITSGNTIKKDMISYATKKVSCSVYLTTSEDLRIFHAAKTAGSYVGGHTIY